MAAQIVITGIITSYVEMHTTSSDVFQSDCFTYCCGTSNNSG